MKEAVFVTPQELMALFKTRVSRNLTKLGTLEGTYQFELSGDGGGAFYAVFKKGSCDIGEGVMKNPNCTVVLSTDDLTALATGKLNPSAAFMTGKLRIKGDMALAMRLQSVLT